MAVQAEHQKEQQEILFTALCAADSPYGPVLTLPEGFCDQVEASDE